jgi:DNA-directed RNA polymerase specialized sigma24 family protein
MPELEDEPEDDVELVEEDELEDEELEEAELRLVRRRMCLMASPARERTVFLVRREETLGVRRRCG